MPLLLPYGITLEPSKSFVFNQQPLVSTEAYGCFMEPHVPIETHPEYPDLATLNKDLAKSLRSLHKPTLDSQAHRIEHCVHSLTRPDDDAQYCRSKLCLECRRKTFRSECSSAVQSADRG